MFFFRVTQAAIATALLATAPSVSAETPRLGVRVTDDEIRALDITIFPDGQNLPDGQGTVLEGKELFAERCAHCHGETGTEGPSHRLAGSLGLFSIWDPLRIRRIMTQNGLLVMSTGEQWPYATSLFDFIRRAMPHVAPKSLTDDQVYALTAYVLHLNGLVAEDGMIDESTLPRIRMPAFDRFVGAEADLTPWLTP